MAATLESFFRLAQRGTDVRTEVRAGVTTFLTMAYIAFVNPQIFSEAGMPFDAVFVATCRSAAFSTLVRRWCTDPAPSVSHARPPGHRGDSRCMIST